MRPRQRPPDPAGPARELLVFHADDWTTEDDERAPLLYDWTRWEFVSVRACRRWLDAQRAWREEHGMTAREFQELAAAARQAK